MAIWDWAAKVTSPIRGSQRWGSSTSSSTLKNPITFVDLEKANESSAATRLGRKASQSPWHQALTNSLFDFQFSLIVLV